MQQFKFWQTGMCVNSELKEKYFSPGKPNFMCQLLSIVFFVRAGPDCVFTVCAADETKPQDYGCD